MGLFVRKVRTASGATAVQIASKTRGVRTIVEHLGSAHDDAQLAVLIAIAQERIVEQDRAERTRSRRVDAPPCRHRGADGRAIFR
jgi:hypothetical protein